MTYTDTHIKTYLVGGAVRDELLGLKTKDFDYTVVVDYAYSVDSAWDRMREHLEREGFEIFLETKQFFTIRARFPKDHPNRKITADFVLARREGPYTDGRHPDWVLPGTLLDDLGRRDFTVNAMAKDEQGSLIDLFRGAEDLKAKRLRAVGNAKDRLNEDALRAFRALRFAITKDFHLHWELHDAMQTVGVLDKMKDVSVERIREELHRCFAHNTLGTLELLVNDYPDMLQIVTDKGIWFEPTLKQAPGTRPVKQPLGDGNACTGFGGTK